MMIKHIVVVGASRGIGKALVERYAKNPNHQVYALARNIDALHIVFGAYQNVQCKAFDLNSTTTSKQVKNIFKETEKIDVLINNAGYLVNKAFSDLTHKDFQNSYQTNVIGVMETVQALLPKLQHGSHIVNVSSVGGFQGSVKFPGLTAYSTSKAALVSFTELFAEEYKDTAIKINCLCLGAVQTEMLEEAFPGYQAMMSAEKMAEFIAHFSLTAQQWMNGKIIPVSLTTP